MFILYAMMILLGVYVAVSKKMESSVKTFIILGEIIIFVLMIVFEVLGG